MELGPVRRTGRVLGKAFVLDIPYRGPLVPGGLLKKGGGVGLLLPPGFRSRPTLLPHVRARLWPGLRRPIIPCRLFLTSPAVFYGGGTRRKLAFILAFICAVIVLA